MAVQDTTWQRGSQADCYQSHKISHAHRILGRTTLWRKPDVGDFVDMCCQSIISALLRLSRHRPRPQSIGTELMRAICTPQDCTIRRNTASVGFEGAREPSSEIPLKTMASTVSQRKVTQHSGITGQIRCAATAKDADADAARGRNEGSRYEKLRLNHMPILAAWCHGLRLSLPLSLDYAATSRLSGVDCHRRRTYSESS